MLCAQLAIIFADPEYSSGRRWYQLLGREN